MANLSILERLLSRVIPEPNSGCWLWMGATHLGYGQISRGRRSEGMARAHRVAYELFVGPIPHGLTLDHLCKVPCCVNPQHLEPCTNSENVKRGDCGKYQTLRTKCPRGHEYNEANTYIYKGGRQCRKCHLIHSRNTSAKRRSIA